jgi:hypothetical protein
MKVAERAPHATSFPRSYVDFRAERSERGIDADLTDDEEGALPTRLYRRDDDRADVMRVAPRTFRSEFPSSAVSRALVAKMVRELPPSAYAVDASRPLTFTGSNVFLTPARTTDPPPPWRTDDRTRQTNPSIYVQAKKARARKIGSLLPLMTLAMAAGICLGLSFDPTARANVVAKLTNAMSRVGAFVVDVAIR